MKLTSFFFSDIQTAFDIDWANNTITYSGWNEDASDNGVIAYKLLSHTGNGDEIDRSKVSSSDVHIWYFTIILRAHVAYEMINSQRGAWHRVGYNHLISDKREWNNSQEILLDLADFAMQELPESVKWFLFLRHGIMAHIPWPLSQSNSWNCIIQWLSF